MIKISKDTKNLAIITLFTVAIWIGFEIYKTYNDTSIPAEYEQLAKPIDTIIDVEFLDSLFSK